MFRENRNLYMECATENLIVSAREVREVDPEQSLSMISLIENSPIVSEEAAAKVEVLKSFHHSRLFSFRKTLESAMQALEVLGPGDDPLWLSRLNGRLAIGFHSLGDLVRAYRHYCLQIKFAERIESSEKREELFLAYHNLAYHYSAIGDIKRASKNYEKAGSYVSRDEYLFGFLQVNYAQCSIKQNDLELASVQAQLANEIGQAMNVPRICHYALPVLASLAALADDTAESERLCFKALAFANEHQLPDYHILLQLLELYLTSGRMPEARDILLRATAVVDETDDKIHATKLHELAGDFYEQTGDYQSALKHHKAFYRLKMEVFSIEIDDLSYAQQVAQRIEVLEAEYTRLKSHNKELQRRVVRISEARDKAKKRSETDSLTGLFNRRYLNAIKSDLIASAAERNHPLSIAVVDVDLFKQVNDRFGHAVGDEVLCQLAKILRQSMRTSDLLVRYGGDEFVVIMPDTLQKNAVRALGRLRDAVHSYNWSTLKQGLTISVSVGLASARSPDCLETLIEQADKQLFVAKGDGRDRVVSEY